MTEKQSIDQQAAGTGADRNAVLFANAAKVIPGGVNSPVRAFKAVGGTPRFIKRAKGPFVWDENDDRFIDYIGSWGPAILGHACPAVIEAAQNAAEKGLSFGAPTELETLLCEEIVKLTPSVEQVRLVNSGTEATMSAIRLARGFTQRDLIVKFEGCYHGHSDGLLVKGGSGQLTFGSPSSLGVPEVVTKNTLVLPYNDVDGLGKLFASQGDKIACAIVEPFAGNMNLVKPSDAFVARLRAVTEHCGALLIYDEVMTGFRVALGGAQSLQGVKPDLTTMGKVIGGGMPLAAFGGRKDVMACLSPLGGVYQAGTLSGNPIATTAGLATLRLIQEPGFHDRLAAKTKRLVDGLARAARKHGIEFCADSVGGLFGIYFLPAIPRNFEEVGRCDKEAFKRFFNGMLNQGVMFAPSPFEAGFVSQAHTEELIDQTVDCAERVFGQMSGKAD